MTLVRRYRGCVEVAHSVSRLLRRAIVCESGATLVMYALATPVLLSMAGGALEFVRLTSLKAKLQSIADTAALSTARQFAVADSDSNKLRAAANAYIRAHLDRSIKNLNAKIAVDTQARTVSVALSLQPSAIFPSPFSKTTLDVAATANVVGLVPLCVLALNDTKRGSIKLNLRAQMTGVNCAVYSNSTSEYGISVDAGATLTAPSVCSAGGGSGDIQPELMKDCPKLEDPLAGRPGPHATTCDHKNKAIGTEARFKNNMIGQAILTASEVLPEMNEKTIDSQTSQSPSETKEIDRDDVVHLKPGVYCGGLLIGGYASVIFEPGVYIIKDGALHIDDYARVKGHHVGFYLTGFQSTMYFGPKTSVSLVAPSDGALAGILFFEDRSELPGRLFSILSDDARILTGTIYLSKGTLVIDADRPIADKSAYTAIVAHQIALFAGPHLVLNSNYSDTDVPAPASVSSSEVRLTK